jgi:hypothetical protein
MRLVTTVALLIRGITALRSGPPVGSVILEMMAMMAGVLLLVGLWTPFSGSLAAALELWSAIAEPGDPWAGILLATMGAALALLGPGAWSADARLFGWKRIDVRERRD